MIGQVVARMFCHFRPFLPCVYSIFPFFRHRCPRVGLARGLGGLCSRYTRFCTALGSRLGRPLNLKVHMSYSLNSLKGIMYGITRGRLSCSGQSIFLLYHSGLPALTSRPQSPTQPKTANAVPAARTVGRSVVTPEPDRSPNVHQCI